MLLFEGRNSCVCGRRSELSLASLLSVAFQAENAMDTDAAAAPAAPAENGAAPAGLLPEVAAYAFLLVVTFLVDRKRYEEASAGLACFCSGSDVPGI